MAPKDRATRAKGVSERGGDQRGILIDVSSFWHRMATSVYGGKSRHRVRSKRPEDNAQRSALSNRCVAPRLPTPTMTLKTHLFGCKQVYSLVHHALQLYISLST